MQAVRVLVAASLAFVASVAAAWADVPRSVDVRADTIGFYPFATQKLVAARGRVTIHAGRRTLRGDAARYDLDANRLLVTGDVHVSGRKDDIACVAYALDLKTDRAIVLRVDPPGTLLVTGDDLSRAIASAPPDGAFDVLDLDNAKPYLRTRHATIATNANVRFTPAEISGGTGTAVATPTYLYTFSTALNAAPSSLSGASFDQPYPLFGNANSLLTGHLRYDPYDAFTLALDERLVRNDKEYVVADFVPLRGRRVDVNAFQELTPGVQQQLIGYHIFGSAPSDFARYQLQWSTAGTIATFAAQQFDATNALDLTLSSQEQRLGSIFTYRVSAGYGYDHITGQLPFARDYRVTTGATVATAPIHAPLGVDVGANYSYSVTTYDFPHETTNGTLTLTAGRHFGKAVQTVATVTYEQLADRYRYDARALLGLPDPSLPYYAPDGTPYPGYFAYAGINTTRSYALQTTLQEPGSDNRVQATFTHTRDFPQYHGYGPAPDYLYLDVTRRLGSTLRVEVGRGYDFGWGGQYLTPQYYFAISP